jgi:hypothetical protein
MRRKKIISSTLTAVVLVVVLMIGRSGIVAADTASAPSLIISQLKITSSNGQFVTLYNTTDATLDMSKYQLEYFNNYDLSKATSSRLISLAGNLPPHGYFMVNDSSLMLCYQMVVDSVSLGFSSTAGLVEILAFNQTSLGGGASVTVQDHVGWSKTAATGAQTLPANVSAFFQRQPVDVRNNPLVTTPGAGAWQTVQPDTVNPCKLTTLNLVPVSTGLSQLLPPSEPPSTIVNVSADDGTDAAPPVLPASDIGLMSPQITELLPNPSGSGNDAIDEYIELHNPNIVGFDLTGFTLQSGLTTLHNYKFPAGTILPASSFTAFYSENTGLSLSNTSSQAKLIDPFGNSLSFSPVYSSAKDGQTWAQAKGKWYWTTSVTPNAANIIKLPAVTKKSKSSSSKSKTKSTASKSLSAKKTSSASPQSFNDRSSTMPIHTWTLALIGGLGILYGIYEYRTDLGNYLHQLRQNFRNRRASRSQT